MEKIQTRKIFLNVLGIYTKPGLNLVTNDKNFKDISANHK